MSRDRNKLFRAGSLALFLAALSVLPGEAQQSKKAGSAPAKLQGLKPQVMRAVRMGESIALRDMPAAGEIDLETQTALDRRVINEKNVALE